ncbi:hypothetical protein PIB30_000281 [Stylosanthes scabra]|uniref:Uncharacterized protein n=1 Tax=Stylosanthes scabra TaxID=79078 RepID=A0ABU6T1X3_9FABA|nr:hypothetical protein [Stylosanthes scabra]
MGGLELGSLCFEVLLTTAKIHRDRHSKFSHSLPPSKSLPCAVVTPSASTASTQAASFASRRTGSRSASVVAGCTPASSLAAYSLPFVVRFRHLVLSGGLTSSPSLLVKASPKLERFDDRSDFQNLAGIRYC